MSTITTSSRQARYRCSHHDNTFSLQFPAWPPRPACSMSRGSAAAAGRAHHPPASKVRLLAHLAGPTPAAAARLRLSMRPVAASLRMLGVGPGNAGSGTARQIDLGRRTARPRGAFVKLFSPLPARPPGPPSLVAKVFQLFFWAALGVPAGWVNR